MSNSRRLAVFFMRDGTCNAVSLVIRIILATLMNIRLGEVTLVQGCFWEALTEWCDE